MTRPRSGRRVNHAYHVYIPCAPDEEARWRAIAADEDVPMSRWVLEACRAYELLAERDDGVLTDADWREISAG